MVRDRVHLPGQWLVAALLFAAASQCAHAGIFGKDTSVPQWGLDAYKTPTPDYAKSSSAVVLYDEVLDSIDGQGRAIERERFAVRILAPQGREHAYCRVSFDVDEKINYFREWTIGADEKQYQAKDTDFADVGDPNVPVMLSSAKTRIVRSPAADPGAVVICESEEVLRSYMHEQVWEFQGDIPAVDQAYELDLPSGLNYFAGWHQYPAQTPSQLQPGHWRWEVKDMKALDLRDVKASLDGAALAARATFDWGSVAVDGKENQWRSLGQWMTGLEEHRTDPTPEITAAAQSLVTGSADFYARLKKITEYIQNNVRYFIVLRGIGGFQAHYAGDIFRNRYGDCKDKSTLLISMLQAVGIRGYYLAVDDRRGVVDPDAPAFLGNHMITAIEVPAEVNDARLMAIAKSVNGKRYLIFDPTNEHVPVGNLPDYEQGSYGILAGGDQSQLLALPVLPPNSNGKERKGTFKLDADGALTGTVQTSNIGSVGADLRSLLKETDEKERRAELEKSVAHDLPGVILESYQYTQPPELDQPLLLEYKVTVPQYAHTAGPLLLVRPRVVGDDAISFDDKPRVFPIDLDATGRWHDSFDIALPAGYAIDDLPDLIAVETEFGSYHSTVTAKDNTLHFERELIVKTVELPAEKAAEFRKFESTILFDEKSAAVLKKQPGQANASK